MLTTEAFSRRACICCSALRTLPCRSARLEGRRNSSSLEPTYFHCRFRSCPPTRCLPIPASRCCAFPRGKSSSTAPACVSARPSSLIYALNPPLPHLLLALHHWLADAIISSTLPPNVEPSLLLSCPVVPYHRMLPHLVWRLSCCPVRSVTSPCPQNSMPGWDPMSMWNPTDYHEVSLPVCQNWRSS